MPITWIYIFFTACLQSFLLLGLGWLLLQLAIWVKCSLNKQILLTRSLLLGLPIINLISALYQPISTVTENSYLGNWSGSLAIIWVIGYSIGFSWQLIQLGLANEQLSRFKKTTLHKAPAIWRSFVAQQVARIGYKGKIAIFQSATGHSPFVFGQVKPLIILPVGVVQHCNLIQIEVLLMHELGHIYFKDNWFIWIKKLFKQVYFFNPFGGLITDHLCLLEEKRCDLWVVDNGYSPITYAEALFEVANLQHQGQPILSVAASGNNNYQLTQRISAILGKNVPLLFPKKQWIFAGLITLLGAIGQFITFTGSKNNRVETDQPIQWTKSLPEFAVNISPGAPSFTTYMNTNKSTLAGTQKAQIKVIQTNTSVPATEQKIDDAYVFEKTILTPETIYPDGAVLTKQATDSDPADKAWLSTVSYVKNWLQINGWQIIEKQIPKEFTFQEIDSIRSSFFSAIEQINWERIHLLKNAQNLSAITIPQHSANQLSFDKNRFQILIAHAQLKAELQYLSELKGLPDGFSSDELEQYKQQLQQQYIIVDEYLFPSIDL